MDPQARQEVHELLSALLEGALEAGQQDRLGRLLREHAEVRDLYLAYLDLHAELALRGDLGVLELPAPLAATGGRQPQVLAPRRVRWLVLGTLGLSGLAAALLLVLRLVHGPTVGPTATAQDQATEALDDTVAVLLRTYQAEWEEAGLPTQPGSPLPPGRLVLKSGFAHIEFYNGATVILQGPAEFRLVSRTEAYCARGKLRATVPPQAQGFTIGSPALDLVDRGTEFGLEVDGSKTAVQVFQGQVDLYDPGSDRAATSPKALTTDQGIRRDGSGAISPIELDPAAFLTAQVLEARAKDETHRRHQDWLSASEAVSKDPSLLAYYPFQPESPWSRTLRDRSGGRRESRDAVIVGSTLAAGRWPGKQALEFKQVSDRVRFHVPGEFDAITMMAWVRVDALPNLNNSLMMSDGWEEGELHWQISKTGTIILGVQGNPKGPAAHFHAPGGLTPDRLGRWTHLAVVCDRDEGRVTHYIDGRPTRQAPLASTSSLRIGDAEIGNWNTASHHAKTPIRHFVGCIDEFMVFSRGMSEQEVGRFYAQGRPPS